MSYSESVKNAIDEIRKQYSEPMSDMHLIRETLVRRVATMNQVEMPPLLNEDRRKIILADANLLCDFLATDEGNDAVELVMSTFASFVESRKASPVETSVAPQE